MTSNRRGEIRERVQLLELAGPRDGEQPRDGKFSVGTACAEHDFPPLDGRPERPLSTVVRGFDALVLHERKE